MKTVSQSSIVCVWGGFGGGFAYTFHNRFAWAFLHVVKMEFIF